MDTTGTPVIALTERTGLKMQDGKAVVLGTMDGFVFTGREKIRLQPGQWLEDIF
ncbi:hypothetical protein [Bacillus sp. KH172YL63]|uniref:hypothetical protein n=1 Tax=Bacillus sp. KH172YL63 TaxID=2709784 RepID=UPI0013E4A559|nr:hypothetical protein [Bacillus sp. KH172YL63]BCB03602.1 hypothetical protein KH172YL63_17350 [Bacillus sp. KH172YL63]